MKHLPTLFAASLLLSAAPASAQTTFHLGVRGGLNRALTTQDAAANYSQLSFSGTVSSDFSAAKSAIYAWQAGAVLEVGFGKISLQPALLFSQKGETTHKVSDLQANNAYFFSYAEETSTNRSNWIELPLNVVYTQHGDHGFQLFGGPYVALAVGGHKKGTRYTNSNGIRGPYTELIDERITYGTATTNRRIDAGISWGVGYRQGPVQLQLGYNLGLLNLHQDNSAAIPDSQRGPYPYHDFEADAAYNRVAQLTGTYFFAL